MLSFLTIKMRLQLERLFPKAWREIKMQNILIVVEYVIWKEIICRTFLEIVSHPGMTQIEYPNLLDYAEDVVKADIGLMHGYQQETNKATLYHQGTT